MVLHSTISQHLSHETSSEVLLTQCHGVFAATRIGLERYRAQLLEKEERKISNKIFFSRHQSYHWFAEHHKYFFTYLYSRLASSNLCRTGSQYPSCLVNVLQSSFSSCIRSYYSFSRTIFSSPSWFRKCPFHPIIGLQSTQVVLHRSLLSASLFKFV